jgi:hypothetical protein
MLLPIYRHTYAAVLNIENRISLKVLLLIS